MTRVFISHSSKGDPRAESVRKHVVEGLRAKRYDVVVDTDALGPGRDWCPLLYQWLGECDAAVVLFNSAALDSAWVRREVSILMWRRALNPAFLVVPVLIGEVRSTHLREKGFTDVLPVEFARVPPGEPTDEAQALSERVLHEFADLPDTRNDSDHLRDWISDIAAYLRQAGDPGALRRAADRLGIHADDLRHVESLVGSCTFLAHQMIGTADRRLVHALHALASSLSDDTLNRLVQQIIPTWINAESARLLLPPAAPDRRTVALNARYPQTAQHYLDRAVCLRLDLYYLKSAGGIPLGEDAAEEFTEQCVDAVRDLLNFPPDVPVSRFRPRDDDAWQFLSIDVRGVRPALVAHVVRELHTLFPWLLLILLTGESLPDEETLRSWRVDDLVVVTPHLGEDEELLGHQLTRDLSDLPGRLHGRRR
ncbi:toll/interleukin-1 receptor domain-containing protein [Streptomyces nigrescens]